MRELFKLTRETADRGLWLVLLGGVILQTVFLYQGSPSTWLASFGRAFDGDPYQEWYSYLYMHGAAFVLLGVIPFALAWLLLEERPADLGLAVGDWRFATKVLAIGLVVVPALTLTGLGDEQMVAEYPLTRMACNGAGAFVLWELTYLIYYIGWEAHFRGFMLFSLERRLGATAAVLIQAIPSTLIHIAYPKPESETFVAIFVGGVVFGFLALRARSFLFLVPLHWLAGGSFDFFSCWLR